VIKRIVSGGQSGVDRAALDVALRLDLPCGGWCPKGRLAEDGPLGPVYPLRETPTGAYGERTKWNVRDSDGTLVLTWGPPTDGTLLTVELARGFRKPCLVVDLMERGSPQVVRAWAEKEGIRTLNVAGPRERKCPGIYEDAVGFLELVLGESESAP
jgi:putative molybdenum carrier protein